MLPFGHHAKTAHELFLRIDQVLFSQIRNHIVSSKNRTTVLCRHYIAANTRSQPCFRKMPGDVSAARQAGKAAGVPAPTL